jgi:bile acid:Na+ symporter, BASS family
MLMFHLGLVVAPAEYRAAWREPGRMLRGVFSSVVAVPAVVILVGRAFDLPRAAQVGVVLMAISPGAPFAVRRALSAGGKPSFALPLQATIAAVAVASMPLWVAAIDALYETRAAVEPGKLAQQVLVSQFIPLAMGLLARGAMRSHAHGIERFARLATLTLFVVTVVLLIAQSWAPAVGAGLNVAIAVACATWAAVALGHLMGGPEDSTRTALGVACGARNAGLALFVASINHAPPAVHATLLAYLFVSVAALTPYVVWRRLVRRRAALP